MEFLIIKENKLQKEKDSKPGNISKSKTNFNIKVLNFKKGDLLILHGNLVHGSYPNKSKNHDPYILLAIFRLEKNLSQGQALKENYRIK